MKQPAIVDTEHHEVDEALDDRAAPNPLPAHLEVSAHIR
ncbi:hypothetical protein B0G77_7626 [Paraburkholderia sp. BL10I2N1]|nr:hypothetical protein B0G77_7626 [Paraburkholderia sp. BL10I2N1]